MDVTSQIFWIVTLSMIVASVAWTVTQEEIFREWREVCLEKSESGRNILQRKFFYVFTCEYCFSHWVALVVIVVSGFRVLIDDWRGFIMAFFLLPWIANQWMSLYRRLRIDVKKEDAVIEKIKTAGDD